MEAVLTRDITLLLADGHEVDDKAKRSNSRSVCRKLLRSWNSGKLSQESTGCTCRAASMSALYRDRKASACSAISSGHHENA